MKNYKLKSGNILRVLTHSDPESPDTWGDTNVFLVYDDRQFEVRREGYNPKDISEYLENEQIEDIRYDNYFIFPVDAYIHSGVHLSLANTADYPDRRWDVSTTGYVLVDVNDVDFNLNRNSKPEWKDKTDEELATIFAEGLIETWNQYLSGDIWGFQVLEPIKTFTIKEEDLEEIEHGSISLKEFRNIAIENIEYEEIDSCWGFYGEDIKTNGILDHIDDELLED